MQVHAAGFSQFSKYIPKPFLMYAVHAVHTHTLTQVLVQSGQVACWEDLHGEGRVSLSSADGLSGNVPLLQADTHVSVL